MSPWVAAGIVVAVMGALVVFFVGVVLFSDWLASKTRQSWVAVALPIWVVLCVVFLAVATIVSHQGDWF